MNHYRKKLNQSANRLILQKTNHYIDYIQQPRTIEEWKIFKKVNGNLLYKITQSTTIFQRYGKKAKLYELNHKKLQRVKNNIQFKNKSLKNRLTIQKFNALLQKNDIFKDKETKSNFLSLSTRKKKQAIRSLNDMKFNGYFYTYHQIEYDERCRWVDLYFHSKKYKNLIYNVAISTCFGDMMENIFTNPNYEIPEIKYPNNNEITYNDYKIKNVELLLDKNYKFGIGLVITVLDTKYLTIDYLNNFIQKFWDLESKIEISTCHNRIKTYFTQDDIISLIGQKTFENQEILDEINFLKEKYQEENNQNYHDNQSISYYWQTRKFMYQIMVNYINQSPTNNDKFSYILYQLIKPVSSMKTDTILETVKSLVDEKYHQYLQ